MHTTYSVYNSFQFRSHQGGKWRRTREQILGETSITKPISYHQPRWSNFTLLDHISHDQHYLRSAGNVLCISVTCEFHRVEHINRVSKYYSSNPRQKQYVQTNHSWKWLFSRHFPTNHLYHLIPSASSIQSKLLVYERQLFCDKDLVISFKVSSTDV